MSHQDVALSIRDIHTRERDAQIHENKRQACVKNRVSLGPRAAAALITPHRLLVIAQGWDPVGVAPRAEGPVDAAEHNLAAAGTADAAAAAPVEDARTHHLALLKRVCDG